jgi:uncharacterized membrane protein YphA (DoxX/SURF4 family)
MNLLRHPWLSLVVRFALGTIFVAAALPKIADPPVFAHNIYMFAMVPESFVNLQALLMPGVELVAGLALIAGVRPRAAAWLCTLMLLMFVVGLAINIARGNPVICSCFDPYAVQKPCAEQLDEMKMTILRDFGYLLLAAHVIWSGGGRVLAVAPDTEVVPAA